MFAGIFQLTLFCLVLNTIPGSTGVCQVLRGILLANGYWRILLYSFMLFFTSSKRESLSACLNCRPISLSAAGISFMERLSWQKATALLNTNEIIKSIFKLEVLGKKVTALLINNYYL